ncbi:MAG TPA: hypothetical protein VGE04_04215 [Chloroflexia bacterium]
MTRTSEFSYIKVGAVAAALMAVSAFVFFALFNALSTADPRTETAQFLSDAATRQGLAATVAWTNTVLGILTVPLYLGLYYAFRRSSQSYMLLALIAGIAWGLVLVIITPVMFTLLVQVAPGWASSSDLMTRNQLANSAVTLGWVINTTIGGTVFFLRAVSVLLVSRVMLQLGGRLWVGLAWLGLIFALEHVVTGIQRVFVTGSGGAAGSTMLGAIGGVMLSIWLIGVGIGLWRRHETEPSTLAGESLPRTSLTTMERAG